MTTFDSIVPQSFGKSAPFYEVWFLKMNDPTTRNAYWFRYTTLFSSLEATTSCWYIIFDRATNQTHFGKWDLPAKDMMLSDTDWLLKSSDNVLGRNYAKAKDDHVDWEFSWTADKIPAFSFIPWKLLKFKLASSNYWTPLAQGLFRGQITHKGKTYSFQNAPGSIGHIWGKKMGAHWRWAHSLVQNESLTQNAVIEILSAKGPIGPWMTPRLTTANLWFEGKHYKSISTKKGFMRNRTWENQDGWSFVVDFGKVIADGDCTPLKGMIADVPYLCPTGRRLTCHNTKVGALSVRLRDRKGNLLATMGTSDMAAIETVETIS